MSRARISGRGAGCRAGSGSGPEGCDCGERRALGDAGQAGAIDGSSRRGKWADLSVTGSPG